MGEDGSRTSLKQEKLYWGFKLAPYSVSWAFSCIHLSWMSSIPEQHLRWARQFSWSSHPISRHTCSSIIRFQYRKKIDKGQHSRLLEANYNHHIQQYLLLMILDLASSDLQCYSAAIGESQAVSLCRLSLASAIESDLVLRSAGVI